MEGYLARRSWTESPGSRRHIAALKETTLSLHEVSEAKPGAFPALGGVSPRAAVKTAKGRAKVAAWLKTLENGPGRAGDPDGAMAPYDFTWVWREFDTLSLRK